MTMIERVAWAIEDARIGYSIDLTRLVDGVSTYKCTVDGVDGIKEFGSHGEAFEFVTARRREAQARAAIEAMREPTKAMLEAGMDFDEKSILGSGACPPTVEDCQAGEWRAMIDAALHEGEIGKER